MSSSPSIDTSTAARIMLAKKETPACVSLVASSTTPPSLTSSKCPAKNAGHHTLFSSIVQTPPLNSSSPLRVRSPTPPASSTSLQSPAVSQTTSLFTPQTPPPQTSANSSAALRSPTPPPPVSSSSTLSQSPLTSHTSSPSATLHTDDVQKSQPSESLTPSHFLLESTRWAEVFFKALKKKYIKGDLDQLSDVDLLNPQGDVWPAQQLFLAIACPTLEYSMMYKPKEVADESKRRLYFPEVTIDEWKLILEFLYTGRLRATVDEIQLIKKSSALLGIEELNLLCEAALEQSTQKTMADSETNSLNSNNNAEPVHQNDKAFAGVAIEHSYSERGSNNNDKESGSGYRCCKCDKVIEYGKDLIAHERFHKESTRKTLGSKIVLPEEMSVTVVEAAVNLSCRYCHKVLLTENSRWHHERLSHLNDKLFACPECRLKFSTEIIRDRHRVKEHGLREDAFPCEECDRQFGSEALLRSHKARIHKDAAKYPPTLCPNCSQEIPYGSVLKHRKTCKVGRFTCEYCGKVMSNHTSFTRHVHKHTSQGTFHCRFCKRLFTQQRILARHRRVCTLNPMREHGKREPAIAAGDRACLVREDRSSGATDLSEHRAKYHTDSMQDLGSDTDTKQAIPCKSCKFLCSTKSGLVQHMRCSHPNTQGNFHCFICPLPQKATDPSTAFITKKALFRHGNNEHQLSFHSLLWLEKILHESTLATSRELQGCGTVVRFNPHSHTLSINGTPIMSNRLVIRDHAEGDTKNISVIKKTLNLGKEKKVEVVVWQKRRKSQTVAAGPVCQPKPVPSVEAMDSTANESCEMTQTIEETVKEDPLLHFNIDGCDFLPMMSDDIDCHVEYVDWERETSGFNALESMDCAVVPSDNVSAKPCDDSSLVVKILEPNTGARYT